jgi:alkylation response protein AidB-like acyl-CoA dehydrogenase
VIDLELTEDQAALREILTDFAERELRPVAAECDVDRRVPEALAAKLRRLEVTTPYVAGDGLGGMTPLDYFIAAEELAYGDPGIAYGVLSSDHATLLLGLCGSPEQQAEHLPTLADGGLGSVLYYEGWGRRPGEIEATAAREPAGYRRRLDHGRGRCRGG